MILCATNGTEDVDKSRHSALCPEYVSFTHTKCGPHSNGTLKVEDIQIRKKEYKFVVCIHGPLRGLYPSVYRFVEHVEVYTMFGADRYVLYNASINPALKPYVDYYVGTDKMEVHKWQIPNQHTHNGGQIALINECLYRYMFKTKYLAFVDIDEFIIPRQNMTWEAMLGRSKCFNHAEAQFRNVFFHRELANDSRFMKNDTLKSLGDMVTLSKTLREKDIRKCGYKSKVITRPELIWLGTVHFVAKAMEPGCCFETHLGLLHHYRRLHVNKEKPITLEPDYTMFKYQEKIVQSMQKVLAIVAANKTS